MDVSVKEKILCEANKIIAEKGLNSFTLEEVAKGAGVSKGGLLYHYHSKDQLIKGLIEYYIEQCENRIMEREKSEIENSPSNSLISFIHEQFSQTMTDSNMMAGFLAAISMNQELLEPVRKKRKEWLEQINNLEDPIMGMIISFACDGIAFSKLLGLDVFTDDTKLKVQERLINLTKDCYKR
jgi:AcrR family transcriptional regulator